MLTADSTFGMTRADLILTVKTNVGQLGVFFTFMAVLLIVLVALSLRLSATMARMMTRSALRKDGKRQVIQCFSVNL